MAKFIYSFLIFLLFFATRSFAQESPFFVTYNHHMEEPGNLDIEVSTTNDIPKSGQRFYFAPYTEFEYGVTAQWTTEFYLEGQSTWADSTVFTGWRIENRYKPMKREHWINPVLYLEYENLNEASRIQKEEEGEAPDVSSPNALLTPEHVRELETKLILSSDYHDWNIAENFLMTKNFAESEGFEFGYSFGVSHPLGTLASGATVASAAKTLSPALRCTAAWAARSAWACTTRPNTSRRYFRGRSATTRLYDSLPASDCLRRAVPCCFDLDIPMKYRTSEAKSLNSSDGNNEAR